MRKFLVAWQGNTLSGSTVSGRHFVSDTGLTQERVENWERQITDAAPFPISSVHVKFVTELEG